MAAPHAAATRPPAIPARVWRIATVTGAGAFMAMLDSTVVNLAVESIRAEFDTTLAMVQWTATGYLLALAVSLPAAGWLGDRYGHGRVWTTCLAAFVAGSVLCAFAAGPTALVAARCLQGLAAGPMVPAGQAIVRATAGPRQLGRIMGVLGFAVALGPALGPALGGLVIETASWRWLFWINVPVGVAALLAARGVLPAGTAVTGRALDRRGLALLGTGLPLLLYGAAAVAGPAPAPVAVPSLATGAVLATAFVVTTRRARDPLLDLRLLRRGRFTAATATVALTGANMYAGLLLLPLHLQLVAGLDVAQTGLMLLAMGLGSAVALPAAGALTDRYGAGPVALAGSGLLIATAVPFLLPDRLPTAALALALALRGAGLALAQMPAVTAAYVSVAARQAGDAATLVNIVQRTAAATGAVAMAVVLGPAGGGGLAAFLMLLALSAATLLPASLLHRPHGLPQQERG